MQSRPIREMRLEMAQGEVVSIDSAREGVACECQCYAMPGWSDLALARRLLAASVKVVG
jgi:hypothetical protein